MVSAVSAADREAWLQQHAVECVRYGCRLSPMACEQHQAASPERCKGCQRFTGEVPVLRQIKSSVARFPRRNKVKIHQVSKHKVGECRECKRTMPLPGRGLCGKCYSVALKSEGKTKTRAKVGKPAPAPLAPPAADLVTTSAPLPVVSNVFSGADWLFHGEDEMRKRIEAEAKTDRRDVRQQVLWLLESVLSR